jgi:transposase
MARLRGRCRRGQRLIGKIALARWHTATFVAALPIDRLTAPVVLDGPIDGVWLLAYAEQVLCPILNPDDVVSFDNFGAHAGDKIHSAIEAHGARLLYLPKYSPDLYPSENAFAKLKAALLKAA